MGCGPSLLVTTALHASGVSRLLDEPLSRELEGNMSGRVARVSPGVATLLYDIDDTELALAALPKEIRPPARKSKVPPVIIVGPPTRWYVVKHTFKHFVERGFEELYWLRTPEAFELDNLAGHDAQIDPKKE